MTKSSQQTRPLNIVWRRRVLDRFLEASFIREVLLASLRGPMRWIAIEDDAALPLMNDILVCSFVDPSAYLRELRRSGHRNIGVMHLGDEIGQDDRGFYADADYVLRNYYIPEDFRLSKTHGRPTLWVPNGWATGVGPRASAQLLPITARRHDLFFAGFVSGPDRRIDERISMLDVLREHRIPATILLSEDFGQGLGTPSYSAYMADAKLALAPGGNAAETIRFYDALECGALPVVIDAPWLHAEAALGLCGPPPIVILDSWTALPDALAGYLSPSAEAGLSAQADACRHWWRTFKLRTGDRVTSLIETAFAAT